MKICVVTGIWEFKATGEKERDFFFYRREFIEENVDFSSLGVTGKDRDCHKQGIYDSLLDAFIGISLGFVPERKPKRTAFLGSKLEITISPLRISANTKLFHYLRKHLFGFFLQRTPAAYSYICHSFAPKVKMAVLAWAECLRILKETSKQTFIKTGHMSPCKMAGRLQWSLK